MSSDIKEYYDQSIILFQKFKDEVNRSGKLTLAITEHFYSLQRTKIASIYRKNVKELTTEDKKLMDEIVQLFQEALRIKNDLVSKAK